MNKEKISAQIIALETSALEKWNNGNPSGYLEILAPDITYFDPFQEKRIDGYGNMETFYESLRGKGHVDRYEMIGPKVQVSTDTATLTYNLNSYCGDKVYKWNCTEVYQLGVDGKWMIIHNHWSFIRPMDMGGVG